MPKARNKSNSAYSCRAAKELAIKHNVYFPDKSCLGSPELQPGVKPILLNYNSVMSLVNWTYYNRMGEYLEKRFTPITKRIDTDGIAYTKKEFYEYYGNEHNKHWYSAPVL